MRRALFALMLCPLLAASALAQAGGEPLDAALKRALADQASADAQTARLEQAAAQAKGRGGSASRGAGRRRAGDRRGRSADQRRRRAAAARVGLCRRLPPAAGGRAAAGLLAARGPRDDGPASAAARRSPIAAAPTSWSRCACCSTATMPVIRSRTGRLSAELAQGQRLQQAALAARAELARSRDVLSHGGSDLRRSSSKAVQRALASRRAGAWGQRRRDGGRRRRRAAARRAGGQPVDPARRRPARRAKIPRRPARSRRRAGPPSAVRLSAAGSRAGHRRRRRGQRQRRPVARADAGDPSRGAGHCSRRRHGRMFAGPFRGYDGVLIIDHGGGWLSLIVNVASTLHPGDTVQLGDADRARAWTAAGRIVPEWAANLPALIAGSSPTLSKAPKAAKPR